MEKFVTKNDRPLPYDLIKDGVTPGQKFIETLLLFLFRPLEAFSKIPLSQSVKQSFFFGMTAATPLVIVIEILPDSIRRHLWSSISDPSFTRTGWVSELVIFKIFGFIFHIFSLFVVVYLMAYINHFSLWVCRCLSKKIGITQTLRLYGYLCPIVILPSYFAGSSMGWFVEGLLEILVSVFIAFGISKIHGISFFRSCIASISPFIIYHLLRYVISH